MNIRTVFGKTKWGTDLTLVEMSFTDFYDTITYLKPSMCKDKGVQAYFLATADFDTLYRKGEHINASAEYGLIIVDGDKGSNGKPISKEKDVHLWLKKEGYNHIVVSSFSKSTEVCKWRAIITAEGVTKDTLESTSRYIVDRMQKSGLSIEYAIENKGKVQPWFFGGMKYPELQEKYMYQGGQDLKAVVGDIDKPEVDKSNRSNIEMLKILTTGGTGYHDTQRNYSWGKMRDGVPSKALKRDLRDFLELWKDDTPRWKDRYNEVDGLIDKIRNEKRKEVPYIKYNIVDRIENAWVEREDRAKNGWGLETHIPGLNKLIKGFSKKNTITIGGSTGKGKTALALNIVSHISNTVPVLFLSLEMTEEQIFERLAVQECGDIDNIPREAYDIVSKKNLIVHDSGCNKIDLIEELSLRVKKHEGIELIVVDHIHKIRKHKNNTLDSLQDITERLSSLAKELNVPICMLSQMNRATTDDKGKEKKPVLSNLRGSGSIEEDSNIVLLINRPINIPNSASIIVAKNRNGAIGSVPVKFTKERARFTDAKPLTKVEIAAQIEAKNRIEKPRTNTILPKIFT